MIQEYFINNKVDTNGIILYAGINEYDQEIFTIFKPNIQICQFYYNCGKQFVVDRFMALFQTINGNIIFANGNVCHIYKFESTFIKIKSINGNLIKRHKKGGQSSLRFSRLAEESRHEYITHVVDCINQLCRIENISNNCWIYGSDEIITMILNSNNLLVNLKNGGFLDFNDDTIKNTNEWMRYLTDEHNIKDDKILEEIVKYLDTNVDMLDFDESNKDQMKTYLTKEIIEKYKESKYYNRVKYFNYVGIKYYNYDGYDEYDE